MESHQLSIASQSTLAGTMHSHKIEDQMALDREEKFLESRDDHSDIVGMTANEKAMTRRILLNLDFRYVETGNAAGSSDTDMWVN
jgi:hypothetical protein